jgi:hypothetical protein
MLCLTVYMRTWRLAYANDMTEEELKGYIFELEYAAAEARDLLKGLKQ